MARKTETEPERKADGTENEVRLADARLVDNWHGLVSLAPGSHA